MPRYRVRRRIEQETTVIADDEQDAETIARSLPELEWEEAGYVELEAGYDFRKSVTPPRASCPKELLN